MIFFQINGKSISPPKDISQSFESLDIVDRTLDGTMVVDVVGKKLRIDVVWDYLSKEDMSLLSGEVNNHPFVNISFRSNVDSSLENKQMSTKELNYQTAYDWVKAKVLWKNVSVSFVEI